MSPHVNKQTILVKNQTKVMPFIADFIECLERKALTRALGILASTLMRLISRGPNVHIQRHGVGLPHVSTLSQIDQMHGYLTYSTWSSQVTAARDRMPPFHANADKATNQPPN